MLHKDNCKPIREAFEFLDWVRLILEILWYVYFTLAWLLLEFFMDLYDLFSYHFSDATWTLKHPRVTSIVTVAQQLVQSNRQK